MGVSTLKKWGGGGGGGGGGGHGPPGPPGSDAYAQLPACVSDRVQWP